MKVTKNILAIAVIALALASCEEGPAGIFSRVADEKSTTDNMTKAIEKATPTFVARLNTTYYSGMGTLWQKADGANQWTQVDTSGISSKTLIATSGAVAGTRLYVAFVEADGRTDLGVFYTTDGSNWSSVTGLPSGQGVKTVLSANGTVFVVTADATSNPDTYTISSSTDTAFLPTSISASTVIGVPTSVAHDGTNYVFSAGGRLIVGPAVGSLTVNVGPADWASTASTTTYGGVCTDGSGFIVSGRNGKLYYSADGSTWSDETAVFSNSKSKAYSLSEPTYISTGTVLVVGTELTPRGSSDIPPTDGYLEFNYGASFSTSISPVTDHSLITDASNFESSLSEYSVTGMPYFSAANKLFAMTTGNGLWSNTYDLANTTANKWSGWVRE